MCLPWSYFRSLRVCYVRRCLRFFHRISVALDVLGERRGSPQGTCCGALLLTENWTSSFAMWAGQRMGARVACLKFSRCDRYPSLSCSALSAQITAVFAGAGTDAWTSPKLALLLVIGVLCIAMTAQVRPSASRRVASAAVTPAVLMAAIGPLVELCLLLTLLIRPFSLLSVSSQVLVRPHAIEALNRFEFLSLLCTTITCVFGIFYSTPGCAYPVHPCTCVGPSEVLLL